jgi:hypothetical protein
MTVNECRLGMAHNLTCTRKCWLLLDDDGYITPLSFDDSRASHTPEKTVNPQDPADPLSYPFIFDCDDYITPLSFDVSHPSPSAEKPVDPPYKHDCDGHIAPRRSRLKLAGRHVKPVGAEDPADLPFDPFVLDCNGHIKIVHQNRNVRH